MKRSKIFLGITASVLAVVAFAAAKTSKFTGGERGYYLHSSNNLCTLQGAIKVGWTQQINSANQLSTQTGAAGVLLYSRNPSGICVTPLYTKNPQD